MGALIDATAGIRPDRSGQMEESMAESTTKLPDLPWTGGCQCGQVRYELTEHPLTLYACHCTECRKQSTSAFGMSLIVRRRSVTYTGELGEWWRPTDSGAGLTCRFCPHCGSRVFHDWEQPGVEESDLRMTIKGGSLDSGFAIAPVAHIWTRSKHPVTIIPEDVLVFEKEPDDEEIAIRAFARTYLN